jgi:PAS domain S-box-containing protein
MNEAGDVHADDPIHAALQRLRERADPADHYLIDTLADQIDELEGRSRRAEQECRNLLHHVGTERAMLRAVIDQMPAGVIVVDAPSGRLVLENEQGNRILGHRYLSADDARKLFGQIGFHPDGRPYTPEEWPISRSINTGETITNEEIVFVRADGTTGYLEVSSAPITCSGGAPRYCVAAISDITERKRAEEARLEPEKQLRNLIENSADGILITDEAGRITIWNRGMEMITGLAAGEMLGVPAWEALSGS